MNFNQKALTMGHKLDASNNLFDMYARYYDLLPNHLKPKLSRSNEKKISYESLGSENKIDTAGAGEIGRSDTLQALHLTEVAFYPDAKGTLLGLLQGAKYAKAVFIESTANGIGDEFYNRWKSAKEGISEFVPLFISWLEFPTYRKEFLTNTQREILMNSLSDREQILINLGAEPEQLNWRRKILIDSCAGDEDKFQQEYPATEEQAFVTTGRPVFPVNICMKNLTNCPKEISRGNLEYVTDKTVRFIPDEKGLIKIFKEIKFGQDEYYKFAAGVDVAEGLEQGDYSVIRVLDRETDEVCLVWHGHIDFDLFSKEIHKIQLYLGNKVYFNIERNNHGHAVIIGCYNLRVNLYYEEDFRHGYSIPKQNIGFVTTGKSKGQIIKDLNEWIRDGLYKDNDKNFWEETLTFVTNARGQMQAQGKDKNPNTKSFDDRIMAEALMIKCHYWLPSYHKLKEKIEPHSRRITKLKHNQHTKFTKF